MKIRINNIYVMLLNDSKHVKNTQSLHLFLRLLITIILVFFNNEQIETLVHCLRLIAMFVL